MPLLHSRLMPYRRMYRRRYAAPRNPIQSFKKVLNYAGASHAAATKIDFPISLGQDGVAAGQGTATDQSVPTGSVIRSFEIQYTPINLVSQASVLHVSVQQIRSGQATISPDLVGGSGQRNQVFYQRMVMLGANQQTNMVIKFKVPKKFGRVREDDQWVFTVIADTVFSSACQIIYKFYR